MKLNIKNAFHVLRPKQIIKFVFYLSALFLLKATAYSMMPPAGGAVDPYTFVINKLQTLRSQIVPPPPGQTSIQCQVLIDPSRTDISAFNFVGGCHDSSSPNTFFCMVDPGTGSPLHIVKSVGPSATPATFVSQHASVQKILSEILFPFSASNTIDLAVFDFAAQELIKESSTDGLITRRSLDNISQSLIAHITTLRSLALFAAPTPVVAAHVAAPAAPFCDPRGLPLMPPPPLRPLPAADPAPLPPTPAQTFDSFTSMYQDGSPSGTPYNPALDCRPAGHVADRGSLAAYLNGPDYQRDKDSAYIFHSASLSSKDAQDVVTMREPVNLENGNPYQATATFPSFLKRFVGGKAGISDGTFVRSSGVGAVHEGMQDYLEGYYNRAGAPIGTAPGQRSPRGVGILSRAPIWGSGPTGLRKNISILSIPGPPLDNPTQGFQGGFFKFFTNPDRSLNTTRYEEEMEHLASMTIDAFSFALRAPGSDVRRLIIPGIGQANFLSGLDPAQQTIARNIFNQVFSEKIKAAIALNIIPNSFPVAFTPQNGVSLADLGMPAQVRTQVDLMGSHNYIPDGLQEGDFLVNAWDPHSVVGNGNGCDNSMDGWIGRYSPVAGIQTPSLNPSMSDPTHNKAMGSVDLPSSILAAAQEKVKGWKKFFARGPAGSGLIALPFEGGIRTALESTPGLVANGASDQFNTGKYVGGVAVQRWQRREVILGDINKESLDVNDSFLTWFANNPPIRQAIDQFIADPIPAAANQFAPAGHLSRPSLISAVPAAQRRKVNARLNQALRRAMALPIKGEALPSADRTRDKLRSQEVVNELLRRGHQVFAVGGSIRDILLLHKKKLDVPREDEAKALADIDLVTSATPDQVMAVVNFFRSAAGGNYIVHLAVQPPNTLGLVTIGLRGEGLDIVPLRGGAFGATPSLQDDSMNRDFSHNAIYLDLYNEVLVSPGYPGGIEALEEKKFRVGRLHAQNVPRYFKAWLSGFRPVDAGEVTKFKGFLDGGVPPLTPAALSFHFSDWMKKKGVTTEALQRPFVRDMVAALQDPINSFTLVQKKLIVDAMLLSPSEVVATLHGELRKALLDTDPFRMGVPKPGEEGRLSLAGSLQAAIGSLIQSVIAKKDAILASLSPATVSTVHDLYNKFLPTTGTQPFERYELDSFLFRLRTPAIATSRLSDQDMLGRTHEIFTVLQTYFSTPAASIPDDVKQSLIQNVKGVQKMADVRSALFNLCSKPTADTQVTEDELIGFYLALDEDVFNEIHNPTEAPNLQEPLRTKVQQKLRTAVDIVAAKQIMQTVSQMAEAGATPATISAFLDRF